MIRVQDVPDGYTRLLKIGAQAVLFRRMLAAERKSLLFHASRMSNESAMWFLEDTVHARIVWGDLNFNGMSQAAAECVIKAVTGAGTAAAEQDEVRNLYDGVILERRFPWLAKTPCDYCKKWWWSPLTNEVTRDGVDGPAYQREPGQPLLCETGQCPKGSPEKPKTLSSRNRWAWQHFQQCEAVGRFPDDPVVRRNAQVIRAALKAAEKKVR